MAVRFDGTSGVWLETGAPLPLFTSMTVLCIAKFTAGKATHGGVLSVGLNSTTGAWIGAASDGASSMSLAFTSYGATSPGTGIPLTLGVFYGLAITYDGNTGGFRGYFRPLFPFGSRVSGSASLSAGHTGQLSFLRVGNTHNNEPHNGTVENVAMYDRVLDRTEFDLAWSRRIPVGNPLRYFPMVGNTLAGSLLDTSARSALVETGTPTVESGAPIPWGAPIITTQPIMTAGFIPRIRNHLMQQRFQ